MSAPAVFVHTATEGGVTYSGTLELSYATADSIAGRWKVAGYAPTAGRGARVVTGVYMLTADRPGMNRITFSLAPSEDGFVCTGEVSAVVSGATVDRSVPCEMKRR